MDPNGLRVWQVADPAGFGLTGTSAAGPARNLHWRADTRLLRLDRHGSDAKPGHDCVGLCSGVSFGSLHGVECGGEVAVICVRDVQRGGQIRGLGLERVELSNHGGVFRGECVKRG